MTMQWGDRVQETFTTTGTGTITLGGAVTGYQAFSNVCSNTDTAYYAATDGTNWEVGLGTYTTSGNTLARTTIIASSNSGSAVSWAAGTKNVWLDAPAIAFLQPKVTVFLTTGTWTPAKGMTYANVRMAGGGGGGGGTTASTGQGAGGGAGGGYLEATLTAAQAGTSGIAITIGAAGAAGNTSTGTGGAGGATSVGSLLSCSGGNGGQAGATVATGSPASGGVATVTTGSLIVSINGGTGTYANAGYGGAGGGCGSLGTGGPGLIFSSAAAVGQAGAGYGSAGGGAVSVSITAVSGSVGQPGIVILTEYFN